MNKTESPKREKKCLYLVAEKGKWDIKDHLKPLNPIYNGSGWFLEEKHRPQIEQLSHQANMKLLNWPLGTETFDELRNRTKREFLYEKSVKVQLRIDNLKITLGINELENVVIQDEKRESLEKISQGKELLEHLKEYEHLQEQIKHAEEAEKISKLKPMLSIIPIKDRLSSHHKTLGKYRGKKYLGLCVKTIPEFNEKMLGLRKLILLAAAPNAGKTALTIQLAVEALLEQPDACLVYVSLEMDAEEIFTRMCLYHSELDFNTYVLGSSQDEGENGHQNLFTQDELSRIKRAHETIAEIGNRLQIIDSTTCFTLSAGTVVEYVERLKSETSCSRSIVVIDYLQVWPMQEGTRFTSDIEADKWRIGEVKKIRDALNKEDQNPVIVISEARKPGDNKEAWGGDMSDVMGSARGTYTPDSVVLLNPIQSSLLAKLWKTKQMPEFKFTENGQEEEEDSKDPNNIRGFLASQGIAICTLKMPKGRDGMKRFNTLLAFHFYRNKYEKIDWQNMLGLAMKEKNKDKKR